MVLKFTLYTSFTDMIRLIFCEFELKFIAIFTPASLQYKNPLLRQNDALSYSASIGRSRYFIYWAVLAAKFRQLTEFLVFCCQKFFKFVKLIGSE